ncbi:MULTISPECIES: GtrA family protein [unclassified Novosphingobium]|uniref:GtrA family protein n=1 Tax=unclassified Novosphingobium TaxID=2644732 RepID=UPI0006B8C8C7|nr:MULTISPECIES: GtrA family protein [unclassified Novosphingobium]KPF87782.1 polysaccharide biosynthesis protein GtrA [Novosphingobium sp. AAP93]
MTVLDIAPLNRIRQIVLVRYILASVGALAVDMGTFLALLSAGVPPVAASAMGYGIGIMVHWILSSRKVFAEQVAEGGIARTRQKAMFVVSALIGLGVTTLIVGGASAAGLDPRAAKLCAIVVSFAVTWLLRKRVVFR